MAKKEVVVYWAPAYNSGPVDWNILYNEPRPVMDVFRDTKTNINKGDSFFYCPAFKDQFDNMFYFDNVVDSKYIYDSMQNRVLMPSPDACLDATVLRPPSMENTAHIGVSLSWVFFCEESLEMSVTPPYFSKSHMSKFGAIVPGRFNIGKWFRQLNAEIVLWPGVKQLEIAKNDPLMYVKFHTDKKIILKRFTMTPELRGVADATSKSSSLLGKFMPLASKYEHFFKTKTNALVLKHIKDNLV